MSIINLGPNLRSMKIGIRNSTTNFLLLRNDESHFRNWVDIPVIQLNYYKHT